jgi:hypothetical protein
MARKVTFASHLKRYVMIYGPTLSKADREHLIRWGERAEDAEDIWRKLTKWPASASREHVRKGAVYLIKYVLALRLFAEATAADDTSSTLRKRRRDDDKRAASLVKQAMARGQVDHPQIREGRARLLELAAQMIRSNPYANPEHAGEKPKRPPPAHVTFMRDLSEHVRLVYGARHDDAVATLTEIAFPDEEITIDKVRSARRPTTRGGRRG